MHAFIWDRGRMIDLTPHGLLEYPYIFGFNDRGQIVGFTDVGDYYYTTTVFQ